MSAEIISFDARKASRYIESCFDGFLNDPADTEYQRGFLAAFLLIYREGLGQGQDDDRIPLLERQTDRPA